MADLNERRIKVSQLTDLLDSNVVTGDEFVMVAVNNVSYKIRVRDLYLAAVPISTKDEIGLDQVDNTADLDKPLSLAAQAALAEKAALAHDHTIQDIQNLQQTLDNKALALHGHTANDVEGLPEALQSKAAVVHTHTQSEVEGLDLALAEKAALVHGHELTEVNGLEAILAAKAAVEHGHTIEQVEGLSLILADKADKAETLLLSQQVADKANNLHQHMAGDVIDLAALLTEKAAVVHTHTLADLIQLDDIMVLVRNKLKPTVFLDNIADIMTDNVTVSYLIQNTGYYYLNGIKAEIQYKLLADEAWTTAETIPFDGVSLGSLYIITGLQPASDYQLRVRLYDSFNTQFEALSNIENITTEPLPAPPAV